MPQRAKLRPSRAAKKKEEEDASHCLHREKLQGANSKTPSFFLSFCRNHDFLVRQTEQKRRERERLEEGVGSSVGRTDFLPLDCMPAGEVEGREGKGGKFLSPSPESGFHKE